MKEDERECKNERMILSDEDFDFHVAYESFFQQRDDTNIYDGHGVEQPSVQDSLECDEDSELEDVDPGEKQAAMSERELSPETEPTTGKHRYDKNSGDGPVECGLGCPLSCL